MQVLDHRCMHRFLILNALYTSCLSKDLKKKRKQEMEAHTSSLVIYLTCVCIFRVAVNLWSLSFYCSNGPQKCNACIKEDIFEEPTSILKQGCVSTRALWCCTLHRNRWLTCVWLVVASVVSKQGFIFIGNPFIFIVWQKIRNYVPFTVNICFQISVLISFKRSMWVLFFNFLSNM